MPYPTTTAEAALGNLSRLAGSLSQMWDPAAIAQARAYRREEELFPMRRDLMGAELGLRRAQTVTEGSQQGLYRAQTDHWNTRNTGLGDLYRMAAPAAPLPVAPQPAAGGGASSAFTPIPLAPIPGDASPQIMPGSTASPVSPRNPALPAGGMQEMNPLLPTLPGAPTAASAFDPRRAMILANVGNGGGASDLAMGLARAQAMSSPDPQAQRQAALGITGNYPGDPLVEATIRGAADTRTAVAKEAASAAFGVPGSSSSSSASAGGVGRMPAGQAAELAAQLSMQAMGLPVDAPVPAEIEPFQKQLYSDIYQLINQGMDPGQAALEARRHRFGSVEPGTGVTPDGWFTSPSVTKFNTAPLPIQAAAQNGGSAAAMQFLASLFGGGTGNAPVQPSPAAAPATGITPEMAQQELARRQAARDSAVPTNSQQQSAAAAFIANQEREDAARRIREIQAELNGIGIAPKAGFVMDAAAATPGVIGQFASDLFGSVGDAASAFWHGQPQPGMRSTATDYGVATMADRHAARRAALEAELANLMKMLSQTQGR